MRRGLKGRRREIKVGEPFFGSHESTQQGGSRDSRAQCQKEKSQPLFCKPLLLFFFWCQRNGVPSINGVPKAGRRGASRVLRAEECEKAKKVGGGCFWSPTLSSLAPILPPPLIASIPSIQATKPRFLSFYTIVTAALGP